MSSARGLLLDRDGTLVDVVRDEETGAVSTAFHPSHLRLLPGVVEGLARAHAAGFVLAIATNQPGPAKGHFGVAAVTRTNDALVAMLADAAIPIARVAVCMHHPDGGPGGDASLVGPCDCRKPKPGLVDVLVRELSLDRAASWMIGDSAADVDAGTAAGVRTGLVFPAGRCELCPLRGGPSVRPTLSAPRLDALVDAILAAG